MGPAVVTHSFSGGKNLENKLKELADGAAKSALVRVGFLEGTTYPGTGTSVPMIAAIQEFGAPAKGIPPRPYFRSMIKKESPHWGKDVAALMKAYKFNTVTALTAMGTEIKEELEQSITNLTDPPLSPVTLLLRERFGNQPHEIKFADVQKAREDIASGVTPNVTGTQAHPLIWTGVLQSKIDFEVES